MSEYTNGDLLIYNIRKRLLFENKNWLGVICGGTGSGKSYSAIGLGMMIGKIHIIFSQVEFLELLNDKERLKKGDVIVFEEGGILFSSRKWNSPDNKVLGAIFQSFRNLNIAVILTAPHLTFIDVQARLLFHHIFETYSINRERSTAFLKVKEIKADSLSTKFNIRFPRLTTPEGQKIKLKFIGVRLPPKMILEDYEARKKVFTDKVNREALESVKGRLEPKPERIGGGFDPSPYIDQVINQREHYVKKYPRGERVNMDALISDFNLGSVNARRLKYAVEKKLFS